MALLGLFGLIVTIIAAAAGGAGTMTVTPTLLHGGSSGNTLIFTFKGDNKEAFGAGSQVSIEIPAVWSNPTGKITLPSGGGNYCSGVSLASITGTGPWTVLINQTCATNKQFTVVYSNVTAAPATASTANRTFLTKSKSGSGGSLTALTAGSPIVSLYGDADHLSISQQPSANVDRGANFSVEVQVLDSSNNLVADSTAPVTMQIGADPSNGTASLAGGASANASRGVKTFNTLQLNKSGNGYTLTASSPGLGSATTSSFNVNGAPVLSIGPPTPVTTGYATPGFIMGSASAGSPQVFTLDVTFADPGNGSFNVGGRKISRSLTALVRLATGR